MLPRSSRLRAPEDFEGVFQRGRPLFLGEILALLSPTEEKRAQIGIAFKAKAFPKAATRHLYKRKMLEALRPRLQDIALAKKIVVLFQKPFPDTQYKRFQEKATSLIEGFNKAK